MNGSTTYAAMEARRRLAVEKVAAGWSRAAVADFLGVHPVTVGKWVRAQRAAGGDALAAKPHPGRKRRLTPAQEAEALGWLADPPTAHGFRTDLWTAARVAELIRRRFGVAYHPGYLREWLAKRGHSPQRPAKRAKERDPAAAGRWVTEDWPAAQKRGRPRAPTSS
jgi:transposase